jgi:hypothetical protein
MLLLVVVTGCEPGLQPIGDTTFGAVLGVKENPHPRGVTLTIRLRVEELRVGQEVKIRTACDGQGGRRVDEGSTATQETAAFHIDPLPGPPERCELAIGVASTYAKPATTATFCYEKGRVRAGACPPPPAVGDAVLLELAGAWHMNSSLSVYLRARPETVISVVAACRDGQGQQRQQAGQVVTAPGAPGELTVGYWNASLAGPLCQLEAVTRGAPALVACHKDETTLADGPCPGMDRLVPPGAEESGPSLDTLEVERARVPSGSFLRVLIAVASLKPGQLRVTATCKGAKFSSDVYFLEGRSRRVVTPFADELRPDGDEACTIAVHNGFELLREVCFTDRLAAGRCPD